MYLYRTVISQWSSDPATYNRFILRSVRLTKYVMLTGHLNNQSLGASITFLDKENAGAIIDTGILREVSHDDIGTWIRYQDPNSGIEYAHYTDSHTRIQLH